MNKHAIFNAFKAEFRSYLDTNVGFIPGMEINFSDDKLVVFLEEEQIFETTITDKVNVETNVLLDKILSNLTFNLDNISAVKNLTPFASNRIITLDVINQSKKLGLTKEAEDKAVNLIESAVTKHGNKIISGYSGGKDSKVILHLARRACPDIIAVHNSHPEETCDLKTGVVIIKEPKSNFKEYLKYVDIEAQIDGTRVFEDGKTVIVRGKEIERHEMIYSDTYNQNGVFGLDFYYPILFWTDKMVWDYIEKYKLMTAWEIINYKPSRPYRGEIY
ncbi:MAG: hypothetical protein ABIP51_10490 [Bacteroidia bacterium]